MTQTLDLNKMGLAPMSNFEMQEVDGRGLIDWAIGYVAGKVVDYVLDHPGDVAAGVGAFVEGARNGSQTYGGIFYK